MRIKRLVAFLAAVVTCAFAGYEMFARIPDPNNAKELISTDTLAGAPTTGASQRDNKRSLRAVDTAAMKSTEERGPTSLPANWKAIVKGHLKHTPDADILRLMQPSGKLLSESDIVTLNSFLKQQSVANSSTAKKQIAGLDHGDLPERKTPEKLKPRGKQFKGTQSTHARKQAEQLIKDEVDETKMEISDLVLKGFDRAEIRTKMMHPNGRFGDEDEENLKDLIEKCFRMFGNKRKRVDVLLLRRVLRSAITNEMDVASSKFSSREKELFFGYITRWIEKYDEMKKSCHTLLMKGTPRPEILEELVAANPEENARFSDYIIQWFKEYDEMEEKFDELLWSGVPQQAIRKTMTTAVPEIPWEEIVLLSNLIHHWLLKYNQINAKLDGLLMRGLPPSKILKTLKLADQGFSIGKTERLSKHVVQRCAEYGELKKKVHELLLAGARRLEIQEKVIPTDRQLPALEVMRLSSYINSWLEKYEEMNDKFVELLMNDIPESEIGEKMKAAYPEISAEDHDSLSMYIDHWLKNYAWMEEIFDDLLQSDLRWKGFRETMKLAIQHSSIAKEHQSHYINKIFKKFGELKQKIDNAILTGVHRPNIAASLESEYGPLTKARRRQIKCYVGRWYWSHDSRMSKLLKEWLETGKSVTEVKELLRAPPFHFPETVVDHSTGKFIELLDEDEAKKRLLYQGWLKESKKPFDIIKENNIKKGSLMAKYVHEYSKLLNNDDDFF